MPVKKFLLAITVCSTFILLANRGFAQDRCGTDQYMKSLRGIETTNDFENWITRHVKTKSHDSKRTKAGTYKIPVVVHVIHNGESDPTNIPDEQIISQIKVLNDDFKRLNADAASTPEVFASSAGSLDIEFILAKQTPEGLPTNGIVRVEGKKNSWKSTDNYQLKATSYWPAEDYLNLWVCNLTDYLGFSQFPQTTMLAGLESASSNRLTDGVVINYTVFGSIADGNFNLQSNYNRGRTTTHEMGHFLGLRHIWGDDTGACGNVGDYVDDTPDQSDKTFNCPTHPRVTCSNITSMFQNFLDYTNDACMNLFTIGQINRMEIVLDNSPRRASLSSSHGLLEPVPVANDLGIRDVIIPEDGTCSGNISPQITVRNYGNNVITSFEINIKKNGSPLETVTFNQTIQILESVNVPFSSVAIAPGTSTFTFEIVQTNGVADGNSPNNILSTSTIVPEIASVPLTESFDSPPENWQTINGDDTYTWEFTDAPSGDPSNKAMKLNFYSYEDAQGELDLLTTPLLDLSAASSGLLLFDVAYSQYLESDDGLQVLVFKNCNADISAADIIYSKSGGDLETVADHGSSSEFTPTSANDWRTEVMDLSVYAGEPSIQIAFVGVNDWGNSLYLDNVRILNDESRNVTLVNVISPSPVVCSNNIQPKLRIRNSGSAVNSLLIEYELNGVVNTHSVSLTDFTPGTEQDVLLPEISVTNATNTIAFEILELDGEPDVAPGDNAKSKNFNYSDVETTVPFRETFETEAAPWSSISPAGNATWKKSVNNGNTSMMYEAFVNPVVDDEAWLVSPVMDLTNVAKASLKFLTSYRIRTASEVLEVRASTGCAAPFDHLVETFSGEDLESKYSNSSWAPSSLDDYSTKSVQLSSFAGTPEFRLAFLVKNKNENNLYLDNIEFFLSEFPEQVEISGGFIVYPNPAKASSEISIAFNLPESSSIRIEITDSMGKSISTSDHTNILNQIVPLDFIDKGPGVYIIRVITSDKTYTSKLVYID